MAVSSNSLISNEPGDKYRAMERLSISVNPKNYSPYLQIAAAAIIIGVGVIGGLTYEMSCRDALVLPTRNLAGQSPSWDLLQSEMVDYVLKHSSSFASARENANYEMDELLSSTFPHLAEDQSAAATLLPSNLYEWERVHWTLAYSTFLSYHGLTMEYEPDEELILRRYRQWSENANYVYNHNKSSVYHGGSKYSFSLEMNEFSDKNKNELESQGLFRPRPEVQIDSTMSGIWDDIFHRDVPKELDWRDLGCIQEVKNQAKCGSCWAFSATEAVESAICVARTHAANQKEYFVSEAPVSPFPDPFNYETPYKRSRYLPNLSEQQLVDCAGTTGNNGCNGGLMEMAFEYVRQLENQNMCTETEYPYQGVQGDECQVSTCAIDTSWRLTGWHNVPKFSHGALKQAIYQHGAVAVSVEADHKVFMLYKKGVIHDIDSKLRNNDGSCGIMLNHGVAAIGYGNDEATNEPYWIVKNSWGPAWGEEGFIRLARDAGGKAGECGILLHSSFPVITLSQ